MSLVLGVATFHWSGWADCVRSWNEKAMWWRPLKIVEGLRVVDAYQRIYELTKQGIIGYIHDDVICQEADWDVRVMKEFADPKVGLVGFAGGLKHGSSDMYTTPYVLSQLARGGFLSNLRDAEVHGQRFTGECDVAVLDGVALFVRREVLVKAGGWPKSVIDYFLYAEWLACVTRRLGYKIRLVGVAVDHLGGKSTGLNKHTKFDFEGEHAWLYQEFKDVLPWEVRSQTPR